MRARSSVAALLAVAALGIAATGCGGDDDSSTPEPDATTQAAPVTTAPASGGDTAGKGLFTANCSGCHTLADADATGAVGPNLDQLQPDQATVEAQVTNGGGTMPAFAGQLSDNEIEEVSAYVASVAGG